MLLTTIYTVYLSIYAISISFFLCHHAPEVEGRGLFITRRIFKQFSLDLSIAVYSVNLKNVCVSRDVKVFSCEKQRQNIHLIQRSANR